MTTEYMGIAYDEETLSIEEQDELEKLGYEMYCQLENKVKELGLTFVEGFGVVITKFSNEELDAMPKARRKKDGSYEIIK